MSWVQNSWRVEVGCKIENNQRELISFNELRKLSAPQLSASPLGRNLRGKAILVN
jgi:hypothetical protein